MWRRFRWRLEIGKERAAAFRPSCRPCPMWAIAGKLSHRLSAAQIGALGEWPYSGRATEKENVRRLVVTNYPYVVYYHVDSEVVILSVTHSAQEH
jgi:hypothetical protein